jgi:hypothetical protein
MALIEIHSTFLCANLVPRLALGRELYSLAFTFLFLEKIKDNKRKFKANPIPPGVLPCCPHISFFKFRFCNDDVFLPCWPRAIRPGLIKKTLRKFEWQALKNEIDVTKAWHNYLLVSRTKARLYSEARANFILARHSNF